MHYVLGGELACHKGCFTHRPSSHKARHPSVLLLCMYMYMYTYNVHVHTCTCTCMYTGMLFFVFGIGFVVSCVLLLYLFPGTVRHSFRGPQSDAAPAPLTDTSHHSPHPHSPHSPPSPVREDGWEMGRDTTQDSILQDSGFLPGTPPAKKVSHALHTHSTNTGTHPTHTHSTNTGTHAHITHHK